MGFVPSGLADLRALAAAGNPPAGQLRVYSTSDGRLWTRTSGGVVTEVKDAWTTVTLAANAVSTTTTLADIDASFGFTPAANTTYLVRAWLPFTTAATTTGMQLTVANPTGMTVNTYNILVPTGTASVTSVYGSTSTTGGNPISGGTASPAGNQLAMFDGFYIVGAAPGAGLIRPRFRSSAAGSAVTILAGSKLQYRAV